MTDRLAMDRIGGRLMYLNARMVLLREYWPHLDDDYRYGQFVVLQGELANTITPAAYADSWRALAEVNGVIIVPAGAFLAVRRWLRNRWRRFSGRSGGGG